MIGKIFEKYYRESAYRGKRWRSTDALEGQEITENTVKSAQTLISSKNMLACWVISRTNKVMHSQKITVIQIITN